MLTQMLIDPTILMDFYRRLGEALNAGASTLEAETIEDRQEHYALKIRLTVGRAALISPAEDGRLSGELMQMEHGEWTYCGEDGLKIGGPPIDFTRRVPDEAVKEAALAIEEAVEEYHDENNDPSEECVREYFRLTCNLPNPVFYDYQRGGVWDKERFLNEGRIFVVQRRAGKATLLYPPGFSHQALDSDSVAFYLIRLNLQYVACPFREVLLEEGGDAVSILEEFVRRDIISYEDIFSLIGD